MPRRARTYIPGLPIILSKEAIIEKPVLLSLRTINII
jgi:hypothetical protein